MRIAIDARELSGKPTGVGRYLGGLLREWTADGAHAAHGHSLTLYSHRPVEWAVGRCPVRVVPGGGGTLWEQHDLRRVVGEDRADVLFSPAYSTPLLTRVPRVVALHDISFAARPDWFHWREGLRRRTLARRSASAARAVITISEFSRREIVQRFGVGAGKIHVIPPGIDRPDTGRGAVPDGRVHLLYVGSIFNRRHIPALIEAFGQMAQRRPDAHLHIVGDNRSFPFEDIAAGIAACGTPSQITWHRYVPDAQLQQLYAQASGFAFLSEYEGLGLTPLEALSCGIPSVLLDTAVARESCGDAALYVPLASAPAIAQAIEHLLYDVETRRRLLAAAASTLGRYDWARAARDTMSVLEAAV